MKKHLKQWYSKSVRSGNFTLAKKLLYWLNSGQTSITIGDGFDEAYDTGVASFLFENCNWRLDKNGFTAYLK